jgi:hypothetical protein
MSKKKIKRSLFLFLGFNPYKTLVPSSSFLFSPLASVNDNHPRSVLVKRTTLLLQTFNFFHG